MAELPLKQQYVINALPAIGQRHLLALPPAGGDWRPPLAALAAALERVEHFYDSMGGVVGYQLKSLELIIANTHGGADNITSSSSSSSSGAAGSADANNGAAAAGSAAAAPPGDGEVTYHVPPALDLAGEGGRRVGAEAAAAGVLALPFMAEILPVGGAARSLSLVVSRRMLVAQPAAVAVQR